MPEITDLLIDLNSGQYETVVAAIEQLGFLDSPKVVPAITEKARHKMYLEIAVRTLRKFGDDKALEALIGVMDMPDPELCAGYEIVLLDDILLGLFKELEIDVVPALIETLSHPDHEARRKAARILTGFEDESIVPALKAAVEKEEDSTNQIIMKNSIEHFENS